MKPRPSSAHPHLGAHRAAVAALLFTAACHAGGDNPDGGPPPPNCSAGCSVGFTCNAGVCTGGDPQKLDFDVKTFPVSGRLQVDGKAPLAVDSTCTDDQVEIDFVAAPPQVSPFAPILGTSVTADIACATSDGSFATRLPAGTYRVLASSGDGATTFPSGTFVVQTGFMVAAANEGLAWDLTTVPIGGKLTVDGSAPVASGATCADPQTQVEITLVDDDGASFEADIDCSTSDGSFSSRVAPGTYSVLATSGDGASTFPEGTFVVQTGLVVAGAQAGLAFGLTTVPISGKLIVDGSAPAASAATCTDPQTQVAITLVDDNGASFEADIDCSTSDGSFSTRVAPGTYSVLATSGDGASTFPAATFVVQTSLVVAGAKAGLAFALTTVPISGKLTVDGSAPVASDATCTDPQTQVAITLVDDNGASFEADIDCSTSDGSFSTRVAPGTYSVLVTSGDGASTFPGGTFVVQTGFVVAGAQAALAFDLTTVAVGGTITVDGSAPVAADATCTDPQTQVAIDFYDPNGASFEADIACSTSDGSFSTRVAPGTYRLVANEGDGATSFPSGSYNLQDAVAIP